MVQFGTPKEKYLLVHWPSSLLRFYLKRSLRNHIELFLTVTLNQSWPKAYTLLAGSEWAPPYNQLHMSVTSNIHVTSDKGNKGILTQKKLSFSPLWIPQLLLTQRHLQNTGVGRSLEILQSWWDRKGGTSTSFWSWQVSELSQRFPSWPCAIVPPSIP